MKKLSVLLILLAIGASIFFLTKPTLFAQSNSETEIASAEEPETQVNTRTEEYTVSGDDTFTTVMEALGIDYSTALEIVESAKEVFDFTHIKEGKAFRLVYEDDVPIRIEYEPGTETMIVVDLKNEYATTEESIAYDVSIGQAEVTIDDSLFVSGLDAGLSEVLLLDFVDVFAWEIDFATQVQPGDSFTVVYEKRFRNGEASGVGDILKATFSNVSEVSTAYRFLDDDGNRSYFDEEGNSLVRAFLKAPVSYSRITSGYTNNRFHPTLKQNMPHRAIDYAAPAGTPVVAVADGTVTFSGWSGCFGNMIDIRHNSIYETQYAHNSKLLVKAGQYVKQGDTIALVGTTGCSTGNHVHYQVEVNGELQNPLEVEFPKGDAIPEDQMEEFYSQRDEIDQMHENEE